MTNPKVLISNDAEALKPAIAHLLKSSLVSKNGTLRS